MGDNALDRRQSRSNLWDRKRSKGGDLGGEAPSKAGGKGGGEVGGEEEGEEERSYL